MSAALPDLGVGRAIAVRDRAAYEFHASRISNWQSDRLFRAIHIPFLPKLPGNIAVRKSIRASMHIYELHDGAARAAKRYNQCDCRVSIGGLSEGDGQLCKRSSRIFTLSLVR